MRTLRDKLKYGPTISAFILCSASRRSILAHIMLVTDALTIGQVTFILRATIQILSHGSLFLLSLLILFSTPCVATLKTHDMVNHAVGQYSFIMVSAKWVWSHIRQKNDSPIRPTRLLVAVTLFILYNLFTSLSDIGFLGFYTCSVPGPSTLDYPASITTDSLARSAVLANMVNGTDLSTVKAYRCDAVSPIHFGNITAMNCTVWHNSTWADSTLFAGLNTTDSDILMPRHLHRDDSGRNAFFLGPQRRVNSPIISRGMALHPHDTGFQAIFGVPQLAPQRKATLEKAMALEVEMGCMTLGITSMLNPDASYSATDVFQTNGSWREYSGPTYLYDILSNTTDLIRQYYIPQFNLSTLSSDGTMLGINTSFAEVSSTANVNYLPDLCGEGVGCYILGNCTNALRRHLNLTVLESADAVHSACSVLGLGGSFITDERVFEGQSQMLCATASQINMVSVIIQTDTLGSVAFQLTRLPSDLNYLRASYWEISHHRNHSLVTELMPIERYTLNDNPEGLTSHFIVQYDDCSDLTYLLSGPGSGGTPLSRAGSVMISDLSTGSDLNVTYLDAGNSPITSNASIVTKWGGQVGASYILASTGYNGWAARDTPIVVYSTGGDFAVCYHPIYILGFLPLALTALLVIAWSTILFATSAFAGSTHLAKLYGGVIPYSRGVYDNLAVQNIPLIWNSKAEPHLDVVSYEQLLSMVDGLGSTQKFLLAEPRDD
jgi:hypothetical protein